MRNRRSPALWRLLLQAALLAFCLFVPGCVIVDCGFEYHVSGVLVDSATSAPLPGVRLAVENPPFDPLAESPDWPGFSAIDSAGRFEDDYSTGITWGYTLVLGLVVSGSRSGPIPPPADTLVLATMLPGRTWTTRTITVPEENQSRTAPAERWVELGTVRIRTGD